MQPLKAGRQQQAGRHVARVNGCTAAVERSGALLRWDPCGAHQQQDGGEPDGKLEACAEGVAAALCSLLIAPGFVRLEAFDWGASASRRRSWCWCGRTGRHVVRGRHLAIGCHGVAAAVHVDVAAVPAAQLAALAAAAHQVGLQRRVVRGSGILLPRVRLLRRLLHHGCRLGCSAAAQAASTALQQQHGRRVLLRGGTEAAAASGSARGRREHGRQARGWLGGAAEASIASCRCTAADSKGAEVDMGGRLSLPPALQ